MRDIGLESNFEAILRERGKIVDRREGHNVFTTTGKNMIAKLLAWQTIAATDVPYTHRRIRWFGVGTGANLEVTSLTSLAAPTPVLTGIYLVPVQSVEFPTSTSVRFIRTFSGTEISLGGPIVITEAALFGDVSPASMGGTEDVEYTVGGLTTLNPSLGTNPPAAYKAFEGITKTVDFSLELRWELRL
jgi:hypothetical protein